MDNQQIVFIVDMEDEPLHTNDHPVCNDPTCPCHATMHDDSIFSDFWMTDAEIYQGL